MFLVKYDSCGNFKWAKQAGGSYDTHGRRLVTDAAGNVYVCGYSNCDTVYFGTTKLINKAGYNIAFVVKYDATGTAQWAQQGSGNGSNYAYGIALDASNNICITGSFQSSAITFGNDSVKNNSGGYNADVFIAKFNNAGTIQWVKGSSPAGDYDAIGYGIGTDAAGNVYVGGTFGSTYIRFANDSLPLNSYYDLFVVKYNSTGTEQWLRAAGDADDDEVLGLASDASGNIYITGYIGRTSTVNFGSHSVVNTSNASAMFLAKYDASGTAQWAHIGTGDDYTNNLANSVKLDAGGNPNVIGYYSSDSLKMGTVAIYNNSMLTGGADSLFDIFVAKYKANGTLSWARTAGGTGHDMGYGLATGAHNSLYITGEFLSPTISFSGIPLTLAVGSLTGDGDAFIANNISTNPFVPNICMVTVDSILAQNNIIAWDKTQFGTLADSIIIYREIGSNNYKPIGAVPSTALSMFTDTVKKKYFPNTGDPNSGTYRYKIGCRDTAGNYSVLSPYHNTIFITNNSGTFLWAQLYTIEGSPNPVSNYVLMKDDSSNGKWHAITSVAGTQQQAADPNYFAQSIASWRVETQWSINCPITIHKNPDVMTSNLNLSKSNINRAGGAGVSEIGSNISLQVYPNPTNGKFIVTIESLKGQVTDGVIEICNVYGEEVYRSSAIGRQSSVIDISDKADGIYFMKIKSEQGSAVRKIIKQ